MNEELISVPLIFMYLLGVMGIYTLVRTSYRFFKYGENPFSEMFNVLSYEDMLVMDPAQLIFTSLKKLTKSIFVIGMIPVGGFDVFIVILDSMLWLNRELGLGLPFFASWYGPNMEILR